MHRIDTAGNVANHFADVPAVGQPGTIIDEHWLNAVQDEIASLIESSGTTLVKDTNTQLATALGLLFDSQGMTPGGRLTLSTGVAIPTTDQSGKTTVYYTPHVHDRIKLYDGTRWKWYTFTEMSQATTDATKSPAAVATNKNYDVFVWDDGGTVRATRGPAWSSDSARGTGAATTELEFFGGRWVNKYAITNGPAARRGLYVGSIHSDASSQINDTIALRHVWNTYNRVDRTMLALDGTSYNYAVFAWRQANASSSNQLDYIVGLQEDPVFARVETMAAATLTTSRAQVGIGIDSTTIDSSQMAAPIYFPVNNSGWSGAYFGFCQYHGFPGLGRHYLAWLEFMNGSGSVNFQNLIGGTNQNGGIRGIVKG